MNNLTMRSVLIQSEEKDENCAQSNENISRYAG
jgi:hypothetical protein